MNPIRPTPRTLTALMACLLAIGGWQIGEGSWIYAKAGLAQHLLQRAWSRTLAGEAGAKPWPWADTWPVARLIVPSQHIDQIVLEGAYGRTLAFGPGHVESASPIGSSGTIILTGHRDTHFRFLQRLEQNDVIELEAPTGARRRYRVKETLITDSRSASIEIEEGQAQLVLITCYPFDAIQAGGPLRYVVIATIERTHSLRVVAEHEKGKEKSERWSRRPGLNGATCHRFGPETCLTDSYKGGQAPLYDPREGDTPPSNPPQFARSTI